MTAGEDSTSGYKPQPRWAAMFQPKIRPQLDQMGINFADRDSRLDEYMPR